MKRALLAIAILAAGLASPISAHHSTAMFDNQKLVILRGTIKSFSYLNPHSWISIVAAPEGTTAAKRWDVELVSPVVLERMGITRETFRPGDKVVMGIRPLRDDRPGGAFVLAVTANGTPYGAKPAEVGVDPKRLRL